MDVKDVVGDAAVQKSANQANRISPYLATKVVTVPEDVPMDEPEPQGDFKARCTGGALHSVLNEHVPAAAGASAAAAALACPVHVLGHPVEQGSRFMVDRLADKAAYIQHRIATFEAEVEAAAGAGATHPVATAAQQPSYFVGRVCCDTENERLNPQSIVLEGSTSVSHGARVLPTYGYARMYSGVSLDTFQKKMTVQSLTLEGLRLLGPSVAKMAEVEGLDAHRRAVTLRLGLE